MSDEIRNETNPSENTQNENNTLNNNIPPQTNSPYTYQTNIPQQNPGVQYAPRYNTGYYSSAMNGQSPTNTVYSYPAQQPSEDQTDNKKEKKKKEKKPLGMGAMLLICISVSLASGLLGTLAGIFILNKGTTPTLQPQTPVGGGQTVIYEEIDSDIGNTVDVELGTVSAVAKKALPSVVEITTEAVTNNAFYGQYVTEGAGSGVIISEDGYIATNNHVVNGASNIKVRLSNGDEHQATLIGTDAQTDIAVIKINAKGLTPAVFGNSDDLVVGELTVAIGNPLGELGGTVTDGIISALDREITVEGEMMTLLQTNAAVSPGNSGGGLFDAEGKLIGIVNAKSSGSSIEGLGFAIPVNTAKEIIKDLIENGFVTGRPSIGITVLEVLTDYQKYMYGVRDYGVYIREAANDKLKNGDRIIAINGNSVSQLSDIKSIVSKYEVGDKITITVTRNNKIIDVEVTLIDSAENPLNKN